MKQERILFQIKTLDKIIARTLFKFSEDKPKKKLSPTQLQILEYLHKHENDDVYQKELESVLNLRRATISGVLQTMEKNNIISRVVNEEDTRCKKILLNDECKKMFERNKKRLHDLEDIITQDISKEDLKTCISVITRMKENIKKVNKI